MWWVPIFLTNKNSKLAGKLIHFPSLSLANKQHLERLEGLQNETSCFSFNLVSNVIKKKEKAVSILMYSDASFVRHFESDITM